MAIAENPAARLYGLFTSYREKASQTRPIMFTWAEVLGLTTAPSYVAIVQMALIPVAALIPEIETAVKVDNDQYQFEAVRLHRAAWLNAVFPQQNGLQAPSVGRDLIPSEAIVGLGQVASYLRYVTPGALIPDINELQDLRRSVGNLIDEVRDGESLAPQVRRLIVARLHDILIALDNLAVGGADAVESAIDRLVVALTLAETQTPDNGSNNTLVKVKVVAFKIMQGFLLAGPVILDGTNDWAKIGAALLGLSLPSQLELTDGSTSSK